MNLSAFFKNPVKTVKANAPEIMLAAGVGLVVYGTVKACQATRHLDEILDNHKAAMIEIHEDDTFDPPEIRREITRQYAMTAWEMFKLYAPAAAVGTLGVCLIFKGHGILKQRYVAVVSAYKLLEKSYDVYRKRVTDELGEKMDRHFRLGTVEEEFEVTETTKSGKEKKVKKSVTSIDPNFQEYSPYARIFDEFSTEWRDDASLNKAYILQIQQYANDYLTAHGRLFLNDVYKWLGFKQTKIGQVAGWVKDDTKGDSFVDFGIQDVIRRAADGDPVARMWVDGIEPSILLDFNCRANIVDDAFEEYI